MTDHHLEPTPETTIDVSDLATTPVLTVDAGDTVVVRSLDAMRHRATGRSVARRSSAR